MIKHSLKDDLVYISIGKIDFSYRIPLKKIGNTIDWKIGAKDTKGIVLKNVSTWTVQLFTKNTTEPKHIKQFQSIVQEYSKKNSIDWETTFMAVNLNNDYNWMLSTNAGAKEKINEEEMISRLTKKYKLD
jgi:hypothetical protein